MALPDCGICTPVFCGSEKTLLLVMRSFLLRRRMSRSERGTQVTVQTITIDRRQHPREGVMGQLEEITYAAMRKYAVAGEIKIAQIDSSTRPASVIH